MSPLGVSFDASAAEGALALAALAAAFLTRAWTAGLPRPVRWLRALAWTALAALAAKPSLDRLERRRVLPRLAVVLDASPSMASPDDQASPRLARAAAWLKANRSRLEERAEVALYAGGAGARRVSWEELPALKAGAAALDAPTVFSDAASSSPPPERVWLLSDGAFDAAAADAAARLGRPVDTAAVGPKEERPGAVLTAEAPDFVFLHGRFAVTARVEARRLAGRALRLSLLKDGVPADTAVLRPQAPFEVMTASLTVEADRLGRRELVVELAADGPAPVRARRALAVETIRQKHRIMYLAGRPSVEYAHLRHQLKADPNHELVSFVILRNPENVSPVPDGELSLIPFPATEIFVSSLFQFDLFILEDFAYWRFNLPAAYLDNLRRFVAQGGALLVIGGSNALSKGGYKGTPLEDLLPVSLSEAPEEFVPGLFEPRVAAAEHPLLSMGLPKEEAAALWKALPPLDGWTRFSAVKPDASVLLAHPTERLASGAALPVAAVREHGKGKVMLVSTDSTWRWKLGGGRDWRLAGFYRGFWARAVQYLTGSLELKKLAFAPLPERLPAREPLSVSLRAFDEHFRPLAGRELDLRLSWERPDGTRRAPPFFEREPGVFQADLTGLDEGRHRLVATARRAGAPWGTDSVEFRWEPPRGDAPLDRARLKAVADASGGRAVELAGPDARALLDALPAPRVESAVASRRALWSSPAWAWVLGGLLLVEWFLRRRGGWL